MIYLYNKNDIFRLNLTKMEIIHTFCSLPSVHILLVIKLISLPTISH